jgi:hypothetical protein
MSSSISMGSATLTRRFSGAPRPTANGPITSANTGVRARARIRSPGRVARSPAAPRGEARTTRTEPSSSWARATSRQQHVESRAVHERHAREVESELRAVVAYHPQQLIPRGGPGGVTGPFGALAPHADERALTRRAFYAQSCILSHGSFDPISARVQPFPLSGRKSDRRLRARDLSGEAVVHGAHNSHSGAPPGGWPRGGVRSAGLSGGQGVLRGSGPAGVRSSD